jgi:hypothetical protein
MATSDIANQFQQPGLHIAQCIAIYIISSGISVFGVRELVEYVAPDKPQQRRDHNLDFQYLQILASRGPKTSFLGRKSE